MGNVLDSKPASYSVTGSKIQAGDYTNTYAQRVNQPSDPTDSVKWGDQGSTVQIGAKIIQDTSNNQLYIINRANQKVYITKDGKPLSNAQSLVQTAKNYGRGPCMQFNGDPSHPEIYMYTGSDMSPGSQFRPIRINSMDDFRHAMTEDNSGHDINAKYSGMYGQAAISPFQPLGKDMWSGVGDLNRVTNKLGEVLVLPAAIETVGHVIPGFGTFMSVTGIQDDLQNDVDALFDSLHKSRVYHSGSNYDTSLSNVFKDPRLVSSLQSAQQSNTKLGSTLNTGTPSAIQRMPSQSPEQMLLKMRALEQNNNDMSVKQQTQSLEGAIAKLKSALGNKVDWSYFDQMQYGLAASTNNEASLNILTHFANKLKTDVLPKFSALQQNEPISQTNNTTAPPRGGSFRAIAWHPHVINGEDFTPEGISTIKG